MTRCITTVILSSLLLAGSAQAENLDRDRRSAVIAKVADLLEQRYVHPDQGRTLATRLRADGAVDRFADMQEPKAFAAALTERLRALSQDGHLGLNYSDKPLTSTDAEATFTAAEMERWYGAHLNHGYEKVARLEGNVGYLDLRVFAPKGMAGDVPAAAMTLLAQSDALIIDLRQNGGGSDTGLIASYLFDGTPRPLSGTYDRPTDTLTQSWTSASVTGRRFGPNKPVYVLTSNRTFSAAEAFAYDLQALERAVIVGEPTGGGAHPFKYRQVDSRFVLSLAEAKSVNPITGGNWQGVGVKPNVLIPADLALQKAHELAQAAVKAQRAPKPG